MKQPHQLARTTNARTSHEAAARVREFTVRHFEQILAALRAYPEGLTVHEIAASCGLDAHAVGKRMNELYGDGLAWVASDGEGYELTRPGPSGRASRVWVARAYSFAAAQKGGA